MKTKLNNSVRKLKHSKKTSKRFNNKIKSAKKLVKMVPKKNLKKSKKQKKTKSVKKMVGGAVVSVDCDPTEKTDTDGTKYKECKIKTPVVSGAKEKTADEIKALVNDINGKAKAIFDLVKEATAENLNDTINLFIDIINAYYKHSQCVFKFTYVQCVDEDYLYFCLLINKIFNTFLSLNIMETSIFNTLTSETKHGEDDQMFYILQDNTGSTNINKYLLRAISHINENKKKTDYKSCAFTNNTDYLFRLIGKYCDKLIEKWDGSDNYEQHFNKFNIFGNEELT
jgi:hypothetical protein